LCRASLFLTYDNACYNKLPITRMQLPNLLMRRRPRHRGEMGCGAQTWVGPSRFAGAIYPETSMHCDKDIMRRPNAGTTTVRLSCASLHLCIPAYCPRNCRRNPRPLQHRARNVRKIDSAPIVISEPGHPESMEGIEIPPKAWKSNKASNVLRVQEVQVQKRFYRGLREDHSRWRAHLRPGRVCEGPRRTGWAGLGPRPEA